MSINRKEAGSIEAMSARRRQIRGGTGTLRRYSEATSCCALPVVFFDL